MKALKIDTLTKTITYVELATWRDIAPAIGNGCTTFACPVTLANGDTMYIDDEGLFNDFDGGIIMEDWNTPIVGNIILLNQDEEGESTDAVSDPAELLKQIKFISKDLCQRYVNSLSY